MRIVSYAGCFSLFLKMISRTLSLSLLSLLNCKTVVDLDILQLSKLCVSKTLFDEKCSTTMFKVLTLTNDSFFGSDIEVDIISISRISHGNEFDPRSVDNTFFLNTIEARVFVFFIEFSRSNFIRSHHIVLHDVFVIEQVVNCRKKLLTTRRIESQNRTLQIFANQLVLRGRIEIDWGERK